MFSLITNETCFARYEICSYHAAYYANRDRNMFIVSIIETTSRRAVRIGVCKSVDPHYFKTFRGKNVDCTRIQYLLCFSCVAFRVYSKFSAFAGV